MNVLARPLVAEVVQQHFDDAVALRHARSQLVRAPHVRLLQLRRLDERLAAHLDGLAVAGEGSRKLSAAAMEQPERGPIFVRAVQAIEGRDAGELDKLLAAAQVLPDALPGLVSAFGWVSTASLRGTVQALLASPSALRRQMGLAACAMHRVDPSAAAQAALAQGNEDSLRARALRVIGEHGCLPLLPLCVNALTDDDPACAYEAARSAVLLGERRSSVAALDALARVPGPRRAGALALALQLHASAAARTLLKELSQSPGDKRLLVQAIGVAGDPYYVPWLIQQMTDAPVARLAGESFSRLTGLDLAYLDLDRIPPEGIETGPSDAPADEEVGIEVDSDLPWPDVDRVGAWWKANGHRFAQGARYFMGEPPSRAHCMNVLKDGFQRQRADAAVYLCLLQPATPLFNTAAPAWRQQRWLDAMSA